MSTFIDSKLSGVLATLGLSEKESLVYVALIQGGNMSAIKLSAQISLHRQFVYNALRTLEEKGLVLRIGDMRAKWQALSPRKLISIAEERQAAALSATEQLLSLMHHKGGQEFELIEGRIAFRSRQIDCVRSYPRDITLLMICGQWEKYFEEIGEIHYAEYEHIRRQKNIAIRFIGPREKEINMKTSANERGLVDYRYIPGLETGLVNTIIAQDMVDFEIYGSPHITFSMKNRDVAESQALFFESLWQSGVK